MANAETIAMDPSLAVVPDADQSGIWCGLADGSRVFADTVTTSGGNVAITCAGVSTLMLPVGQVVWLLPVRLSDAFTYVSDLQSARFQHVTFVGPEWPYKRDAAVTGTPLRAGGRLYAKGLGLHSASRLSYELAGKYRRFESLVAIDDHVPTGRGSVIFRVRADGNVVYESLPLRSGDEPQPVSVDVSGVNRLSLEVDYADRGDVLDRADWLGARLVK
jgi:hypothetical protein